jgi:hypothetical protein
LAGHVSHWKFRVAILRDFPFLFANQRTKIMQQSHGSPEAVGSDRATANGVLGLPSRFAVKNKGVFGFLSPFLSFFRFLHRIGTSFAFHYIRNATFQKNKKQKTI